MAGKELLSGGDPRDLAKEIQDELDARERERAEWDALFTCLLESIAAERLFVLCGAGLSMAAPSSLPSAVGVARTCRDRYKKELGSELDQSLGDDIEAIARHFCVQANLDTLFIDKLVPWVVFSGARPNKGHEAIADLLACKVIPAAVTTNIDTLLEGASSRIGEPDFRAVVDVVDLPRPTDHGTLVKIHGCATRSRELTIWCREQLPHPVVDGRMRRFGAWLAEKLLGKDLLLIGFWTDWAYLSELFAANLTGVGPRRVYVVNPGSADDLQKKAPQLWAWAHGPDILFHHIVASADEFLDELRRIWSSRFVTRLMDAAEADYRLLFGPPPGPPRDLLALESSSLYALRRDLSGTPRTRPVRDRVPAPPDHVAAAIHRRLLDKGAAIEPHCYRFSGRAVRVVSGRGRLLSTVRADYETEPPLPSGIDQVVCAGASEDPSPSHIVRGGGGGSIVRPGSAVKWTTHTPLLPALV